MLRKRMHILFGFGVLLASLIGCSGDTTAGRPARAGERRFSGEYPLQVVCTTGPVADILRSLGGEHTHVTGMMGPGVDPHLYTAVPGDIEKLSAADMIFYNGLHLEGRMTEVFERLSEG